MYRAGKRKTYSGKSRIFKRSTYRAKRARTPAAPASRQTVARLTNMVRSVRPELKSVDVYQGLTEVPSATAGIITNYIYLLNGAPVNDTISGRNGRKIFVKSLFLRWRAHLDTAPTGGRQLGDFMRVAIVWDKAPNGVGPPGGSEAGPFWRDSLIFKDLSLTATGVTSPVNLDYRDRFVVLSDQTVPVACTQLPGTVEKYLRINKETIYNQAATAGDFGSIQSGALYLVIIPGNYTSNQPDGNRPIYQFTARTRYTDA